MQVRAITYNTCYGVMGELAYTVVYTIHSNGNMWRSKPHVQVIQNLMTALGCKAWLNNVHNLGFTQSCDQN